VADYDQPILVEEYIAGDEVTVGLIGTGAGAEVLGTMRVAPRDQNHRFVYSIEMKRAWMDTIEYEIPAAITGPAARRLEDSSLAAHRALGCRDVARIDFRIKEGVPYFIEANPLPGLAPGWSDLVILARGLGISHPDLILRILDAAVRRIGLTALRPKGSA
jgi:D-alanine-D-alanine ligase